MSKQEREIVAIETSKNTYVLISKILTLMDFVNLIHREVKLPDMLTVMPFGDMEESVEILPEEMLSEIDNETVEDFISDKITDALMYATVDSMKNHTPIDIMNLLYSHSINEILLFFVSIADVDTNRDSIELLNTLKEEINTAAMQIVEDYTNEIITHNLLSKFRFIRFYEFKANCILLDCRTEHGLNIKEER